MLVLSEYASYGLSHGSYTHFVRLMFPISAATTAPQKRQKCVVPPPWKLPEPDWLAHRFT